MFKEITHINKEFNGLTFEEERHLYSLKGKPLKGSVSSVVAEFHEEFPFEEAIAKTMARTGRTKEDIAKEWQDTNEESVVRGNRVHQFGELYPFNRSLKPSCNQELACKKFWDELPEWIIPVGVEVRMYHKLYMFPGTSDILLYDTRRQGYIIADYKTNKDLFKNYMGKVMLAPFDKLLDSPFNHYQVQLSLYDLMLEQIGIHVIERKIIYLDFDGNYIMYNTTNLKPQLEQYLKEQHNV